MKLSSSRKIGGFSKIKEIKITDKKLLTVDDYLNAGLDPPKELIEKEEVNKHIIQNNGNLNINNVKECFILSCIL